MAGGTQNGVAKARPISWANQRLLALEIRRQKIGFVVVEGKARLLDWGVRSFKSRDSIEETVSKKIKPVLNLYSPAIIVMKRPGARAADHDQTVIAITRAIG